MGDISYIFFTGLIGSLTLVSGAAWPEPKTGVHPVKSLKNWLLAMGGLVMFLYALFGFLAGGQIFFVILETLVVIASITMMLDVPDKIDTPVIIVCGTGLIVWSLFLFEGYNTVFFILGLSGIGLGYTFQTGTVRRNTALTFGSLLIAIFSYIEASWVFFWLNTFFTVFSMYHLYKLTTKHV